MADSFKNRAGQPTARTVGNEKPVARLPSDGALLPLLRPAEQQISAAVSLGGNTAHCPSTVTSRLTPAIKTHLAPVVIPAIDSLANRPQERQQQPAGPARRGCISVFRQFPGRDAVPIRNRDQDRRSAPTLPKTEMRPGGALPVAPVEMTPDVMKASKPDRNRHL